MLSNITIQNLAIIDEVSADFQSGFNVLSGETGAGKSIIINALGLVLGDRASAELVRSGAEEARVEALFVAPFEDDLAELLDRLGVPREDELLLTRQIHASGRSQCRLNGRPLTLSMLRDIGAALVDIHGQHEHQSLLRLETHLGHLDASGSEAHLRDLARFAALHDEWTRRRAELQALRQDDREQAQRVDLLSFQVREIDAAQLTPGEEDALQEERRRLDGVEKLREAAAEALDHLEGGDEAAGAVGGLAQAWRALDSACGTDPTLEPLAADLQTASVQAQECLAALRDYVEGLEADPTRLDAIEGRLHQLAQLKRKYGESVEAVIAHRQRAQAELDALTHGEERLEEVTKAVRTSEVKLAEAGTALTRRRRKLARAFETAVLSHLKDLAMDRAKFEVEIRHETTEEGVPVEGNRLECTRTGLDRVQFLLAPNPGEPPKPLARIASGGEMSRVMLAIKSASAQVGNISTWIFDEVDAGIGGATAEMVGRKLAALSERCQALCVTHLAQIASQAEWHQVVRKSSEGNSTTVGVRSLSPDERVEEIARMLGGESLTDTTRRHAAEMLDRGRGGQA